jgi:hypothetical protein
MQVYTSVLSLESGLYILRHPGGGMPGLSVTETPSNTGKFEVLKTNRANGMVLRNAAECVVMHVIEGPVDLMVAALTDGPAVAPAIRLDRVTLEAPAGAAPAAAKAGSLRVQPKGVSIVGHVEKNGDVAAGPGEVLGQPDANLRVEGFQVMWPDKPEGVELAYSVSVEGYGAMPVVGTGNFIGTRREAKRITEVTVALTGPNARKYDLTGTAYFSGGFQVPVSSGSPLGGPSGLEHLTGIALAVEPAKAKTSTAAGVWEESPKTKVFSAKKAEAAKPAPVKSAAEKKTNKSTSTTTSKKTTPVVKTAVAKKAATKSSKGRKA